MVLCMYHDAYKCIFRLAVIPAWSWVKLRKTPRLLLSIVCVLFLCFIRLPDDTISRWIRSRVPLCVLKMVATMTIMNSLLL